MTERLFGVVKGHREHIADHTGRLYSDSEVADLLNTVYEENEQLKKQLDETIEGLYKEITTSENAFEGLMNENKELRDACKGYDWYKLYKQLLNENEQLKNENAKMKKELSLLAEFNQKAML